MTGTSSSVSEPAGDQRSARVLVTGGGGFIGSHLVALLRERGDEVTVVDDFSTGVRAHMRLPGFRGVRVLDMRVSQSLGQLGAEPFDRIYHLAAAVGVRLVIERPIHTIETNVLETSALLRFAAERSIPTFLASTSEVYGKTDRMPFHEDDDVVFGPTTSPRWSYACSKALDEHLALAYHGEFGLPIVIGRFFNTVGPRQVGRYGMVLPRFVEAALDGAPIEVHGDGRQTRCFCDVRDVVRVIDRMMSVPACQGRVINVGHDEPITIADLAALVINTLGSRSAVKLVPYAEAFGGVFDDLRDRRPDLSRLRETTGFRPKYTLAETITDMAVCIRQARQDRVMSGDLA